MENISAAIGVNLRRLRDERRLSLDQTAKLSGVSKSMLGQIERGEASPTVNTVWKIALGFGVPFTALLRAPRPDVSVRKYEDITPVLEDGGRYRLFMYFMHEAGREFEVCAADVDPGGGISAQGHGPDVEEYVIVTQGELTLTLDQQHVLRAGDSMRFPAHGPHAYRNNSVELLRFTMIIHYANSEFR